MRIAAATPTGWDAVWAWFDWLWGSPSWGVLAKVIVIVVVALVLRWIVLATGRRAVNRIVNGVKRQYEVTDTKTLTAQSPVEAVRRVRRTQSLGRVFSRAITSAIAIVAVLLVVWTVFPGATSAFALITAAVGAGLGIGAQGVVRDVLNGIFLAVEDQLGIGDVVTVGETTGVVEDVGIRICQVRDVDGTLWFIRNGDIDRVGNQSHGWARAIVDYAVPPSTDVDKAKETIVAAAAALQKESHWKPLLLERPEVWGIQSIAFDAVVLRVVVRTRTSAKLEVERELRRRIKLALDDAGIAVPPMPSIRVER